MVVLIFNWLFLKIHFQHYFVLLICFDMLSSTLNSVDKSLLSLRMTYTEKINKTLLGTLEAWEKYSSYV